ncbi:MAG TPA: sulfotransferase [Bacteroidia bacterium]|nr:sulfotransferase [Bacteroidia bacterium]
MIAQLNKEYIKTRPSKTISRLVSYFFFEGRPLTTKGQWINPFLFFAYRLICFLPQIKKVKSPVFIVGTGRSGSTLLGILLSMHKQVAYLNEPKAVWHFAYEKEDLIGNFTTGIAYYKLNDAHVTSKTISVMNKLYGFYLASVFSKQVIDKYPELVFRIDYLKKIFPDAKVLFLHRNGFQTAASTAQWIEDNREQKGNDIHDWWGLNNRKWNLLIEQVVPLSKLLSPHVEKVKTINSQVEKAAVEWIVTMEEGISFLKKYPENVMPVKYEELVSLPETALSKVFSFCNLEYDVNCIQYAKLVTKQGSKNKMEPELAPYLKEIIFSLMKELGY